MANDEDEPSRVKIMLKPEMEKVYKNLGCQRVWNLCNFETVEDNLGHMYYKATGLCRFKVFNEIKTECQVKLKFEDIDKNENEWKNIISMDNFPHTHPSPILNAEGFKDWQKAKDPKSKKNIESKSPNSTPATSKDQKKMSPILAKSPMKSKIEDKIVKPPKKSSANRRKNIRKIQGDESSNFEEELLKLDEKKEQGKVRIMTNEQRDQCYDKFSIQKHRLGTILIDNLGHIYGPMGTSFLCKFANWNNAKCPARISLHDSQMKQWNGWIEISHSTYEHSHKSPYPTDPKNIEGSPPKRGSSSRTQSNMTSSNNTNNKSSLTADQTSTPASQKAGKRKNNSIEKYLVRTNKSESGSDDSQKVVKSSASAKKKAKIESDDDEPKSSPKRGSSKSVSSSLTFDPSPVLSRLNPTANPQLHSTPAGSASTVPNLNYNTPHESKPNVTSSSLETSTQFRHSATPSDAIMQMGATPQFGGGSGKSNYATESQCFLPAWTNCKTCKACVLINPQSTTKDLIVIAKTHINQFHGPVNEINKKMIKLHLPNILNLKAAAQIPVSESLLLNDCGDYWCEIPGCNTKMVNMIDESENDNDLINHVILEHLAPEESINNEIFWQCFPDSAPKTQFQNRGENGSLVKQE